MKPAAEDMKGKINQTIFANPKIEIVNNVTAKIEKDPNEIKKLLISQIYSTVNWRESMINISEKGVKKFHRNWSWEGLNWNGQKNNFRRKNLFNQFDS